MLGSINNTLQKAKFHAKRLELEKKLGHEPLCFEEKHHQNYIRAVELCLQARAFKNDYPKSKEKYEAALELLSNYSELPDEKMLKGYCHFTNIPI